MDEKKHRRQVERFVTPGLRITVSVVILSLSSRFILYFRITFSLYFDNWVCKPRTCTYVEIDIIFPNQPVL